jgi:AsmA protein
LAVLLAVVLWLGLGLVLPIVTSFYSNDLPGEALEAAPADAFTISQPIVLSTAPPIRVERGTIAFVDANGRVLPSDEGKPGGGAHSSPNLRLYNALVTFGSEAEAARSSEPGLQAFPASPFMEALAAGRYETLSLKRSMIVLNGFFDQAEVLSDVMADVSLRKRGMVALKGTASVRGKRVAFEAQANVGQGERRSTQQVRVPLKLAIKSENLDISFDGRMMPGPEQTEFQGHGDIAIPSGRALARWFGSYWPSGPGLRDLSVRGQLRIGKQLVAFDNAVARMDGNEATGVLGLKLRQPRPVLSGTLAYKQFDARPYLSSSSAALSATEAFSWSSLAAGALTVPLGMHLDADMRISADRVLFGAFELGRTAATIALKDGRLQADVADVKFVGGEGGGQITADFTGFVPKVTVRGKLDQVDLATLSASFAGAAYAQGKASLVSDLVGSGSTMHDLMRGMAGKLAIRAQSPGRIGIDLKALADAVKDRPATGWLSAGRGATDYDALDMRLVVREGTILTESVDAKTSDGSWTAVGIVNLPADRIDLRLTQTAPGEAGGKVFAAPRRTMTIIGSPSEPRVMATPRP